MPQRSSPLRAHSIAGALLAGESSRTEIRTRSPKWYTKRPHALVDAQATRGMLHEMASLRRQHIPVRWCRRRALLPFHGPVQSVPVGDVRSACRRYGTSAGEGSCIASSRTETACAAPSRPVRTWCAPGGCLTLELGHNRVVYGYPHHGYGMRWPPEVEAAPPSLLPFRGPRAIRPRVSGLNGRPRSRSQCLSARAASSFASLASRSWILDSCFPIVVRCSSSRRCCFWTAFRSMALTK